MYLKWLITANVEERFQSLKLFSSSSRRRRLRRWPSLKLILGNTLHIKNGDNSYRAFWELKRSKACLKLLLWTIKLLMGTKNVFCGSIRLFLGNFWSIWIIFGIFCELFRWFTLLLRYFWERNECLFSCLNFLSLKWTDFGDSILVHCGWPKPNF